VTPLLFLLFGEFMPVLINVSVTLAIRIPSPTTTAPFIIDVRIYRSISTSNHPSTTTHSSYSKPRTHHPNLFSSTTAWISPPLSGYNWKAIPFIFSLSSYFRLTNGSCRNPITSWSKRNHGDNQSLFCPTNLFPPNNWRNRTVNFGFWTTTWYGRLCHGRCLHMYAMGPHPTKSVYSPTTRKDG